ncbi:MAG: pantoate--beta-alanine ligase [Spirochaetales bacterium]|nr:pantoate--beta-alanine ligase [Spirochaetales bacterium]
MEIIKDSKEMQDKILILKKRNTSIGFVPTMGALHEGHLSLIKQAKKENEIVVVSIFVNPKQFGPNEDYSKYPRVHDQDISLCDKESVDFIFLPQESTFYDPDHLTYVEVENLSNLHCGKSRPGHFRGVTTVVAKLFNIVQPDRAYFGKKDFQQLIIIKKMVEDLSFPIEIIGCPIVRDFDGLALSSRNKYLTTEERKIALKISQTLFRAKESILKNENDSQVIYNKIYEELNSTEGIKIDYISIVDDKFLQPVNIITKNTVILIACFVGSTRLIDNLHCSDFLN